MERDRVSQILSELDEQLQIEKANLSDLTSKWRRSLSDNEFNFNSIPGEEDFGGSFNEDLGGNSDGGPIDEDNNDPSNTGSQNSQPKISRKRRRVAPSPSRELNLRKRERKNYNVRSPLRKRCKPKSVSISHILLLQNVLVIRSNCFPFI